MASSSALIALLVVLGCAAAASATSYTVGDTSGWTVGQDYTAWATGKTFVTGDTLVFNYPSQAHTVTEVNKSDYDACSSNTNGENSGTTTKTLTAGVHYYICTIGTHCSGGGMKLAITATDSSSGSPPSAGTPPATGAPPTTPSSTTPSGAPARLHAGPVLAAVAGVLVKLALF